MPKKEKVKIDNIFKFKPKARKPKTSKYLKKARVKVDF